MYRIVQEEPEGWQKAFVIYFGAKRVAHCSFKGSAEIAVQKIIGTY